MRIRPAGWAWVMAVSLAAGPLAAQPPGAGGVSHMNDRELKIPFTPTEFLKKEAVKLLLFVSSDQGKTWRQEVTATPNDDGFPFYAPGDGVYWFNVAYQDRQGRTVPNDVANIPPALKIVVDTRKPTAQVTAHDRQGETVQVNWEVRDEYLDPASLRLEYRAGEGQGWKTMAVSGASGQRKINLGTTRSAQVRVVAQDLAGNQATQQIEVPGETASVASGPPGPPPATTASYQQSGPPSLPPPSPVPPAAAEPPVKPQPTLPEPAGVPAPPRGLDAPLTIDPFKPATTPPTAPRPIASSSGPPPAPTEFVPSGSSVPLAATTSPTPTYGNVNQRRFGPPLQHTNQLHLELDYEIPKVGPSGVGLVELWMTPDDGRTWRKFAEKTEPQPPFAFDVPGEGVYGFTLVVKSRAGLGRKEPQPGEAPEVKVEIDTTAPMAALYPVEADPRRKDVLFLLWKAEDKNLGSNPITLQWAEKVTGPWQPIATEVPNSGRITWRMPPELPYRIFLRLEVRDLAGNLSVAETTEPVLVDLMEPEIKIKGIRAGGGQRHPMP